MPILRLILLLGIASLLLLFVLPNWEPSMQLVFLGIRSPAFPLSLWILGAIAAGILTTLAISILFRLTGFTAQRKGRKKARSFEQSPRTYSYTQAPAQESVSQAGGKSSDWEEDASDWFDDSSSWEDEPATPNRTRTRYDSSQTPASGSQTGSSYSYSYREPKDTRPSAPESVVDADYRVIIPPNRNLQNEDDFEENDRP